MSQIVVFTQPNCGPCIAVKAHLKRAGVAFEERDVTRDRAAAEAVRVLGYQGTPVVAAGDMHTHGYRPDWLDMVAAAIRREQADPEAGIDAELAAVEAVAA